MVKHIYNKIFISVSISNVENELSVRDSVITHVKILQRFFLQKVREGREEGFNNKFHDGYKSHVQH